MPKDAFGNYVAGLTSQGENTAVDPGTVMAFTLNSNNVNRADAQGNYRPSFVENPENDSGPFGGSSGATSGNGSPVGVVDASKFVIYLQKDSVPPLLEWFSNGTTWTT